MVDHGIPWSSDHHFHLGNVRSALCIHNKSFNCLPSNQLSPDYTMKLCFMKLKSCIKFDHVAHPKTLFHGTFLSFIKHSFG